MGLVWRSANKPTNWLPKNLGSGRELLDGLGVGEVCQSSDCAPNKKLRRPPLAAAAPGPPPHLWQQQVEEGPELAEVVLEGGARQQQAAVGLLFGMEGQVGGGEQSEWDGRWRCGQRIPGCSSYNQQHTPAITHTHATAPQNTTKNTQSVSVLAKTPPTPKHTLNLLRSRLSLLLQPPETNKSQNQAL